jgi:hypothetical protein
MPENEDGPWTLDLGLSRRPAFEDEEEDEDEDE